MAKTFTVLEERYVCLRDLFDVNKMILLCVFQSFNWTGENAFFIKGDEISMSVGASQ